MIRVTVEMIPNGNEQDPRRRVLGTMEIINDGTGSTISGHYDGTLHGEYTPPVGRKGRVEDFHRTKQSVWSLVGAFLKLWGHTTHSPKAMFKTQF
jgi:hypothetical protein